jgi:hypothetical protein
MTDTLCGGDLRRHLTEHSQVFEALCMGVPVVYTRSGRDILCVDASLVTRLDQTTSFAFLIDVQIYATRKKSKRDRFDTRVFRRESPAKEASQRYRVPSTDSATNSRNRAIRADFGLPSASRLRVG